jgi:acyl-CoA synthetase (AMP-forming)/AMP-acid ligase II
MILEKFRTPRHNLRTIAFLLFDHIGGIDTLLYSLSNGSCLITVGDRSPDTVCQLIERYRAEVLPASPTFLNLLILRESYLRYDLSSLKYITYGTEVMPLSTLKRCSELFPNVTILQKYGTTEIGTLRSKSKASDSTWVKIGGDGYKTRIVDGILEIKARSAMLGYLNAASPFTADGWFHTGDMVEVDGDYIRILGRKSEIINVGGQKVYPAEVEGVIQDMPGVVEAVVYGEQNAITGQIVCAKVRLQQAASRVNFSDKLREFCRDKLELYKIPVKIHLVNEPQYSDRYKKLREVAK